MVLANATEVDLGTLGTARITGLLGQGGQGHVYEVRREDGRPLALKWYRPECATAEQHREIQTLVDFGTPHTRFLWPMSIARIPDVPGFGYVMALRDSRYLEFTHLLSNKDREGKPLEVSFTSVVSMCRQLGFSFLRLHARGLCYRDISFGNVFFEPSSGDVLICDVDNVGVDNGHARVLGTPFFMAPEVVRDLSFRTLPNTDTDRHSLAVLLFYTLCVGHPLEGAKTESGIRDQAWLLSHFGTDPLFCMHPELTDNRPGPLVQEYWEMYPRFLRDLFVQAFVVGLEHPGRRVTEGQWIKAMDRLNDGMLPCGECGTTCFWDRTEPDRPCRSCASQVKPNFVLDVGRRRLAVSTLATLRSDHFQTGVDDSIELGRLRVHPNDPFRWGLQNVSSSAWTAIYAGGVQVALDPGETVELAAGLRIRVGSDTVTVRVP